VTPGSQDNSPASPLNDIRLLSAEDVCQLWQVRKSWLYDAVESGILPAINLGNHLRFRTCDLADCLSTLALTGSAGRPSRGKAPPRELPPRAQRRTPDPRRHCIHAAASRQPPWPGSAKAHDHCPPDPR
jgi:hypothetical protein